MEWGAQESCCRCPLCRDMWGSEGERKRERLQRYCRTFKQFSCFLHHRSNFSIALLLENKINTYIYIEKRIFLKNFQKTCHLEVVSRKNHRSGLSWEVGSGSETLHFHMRKIDVIKAFCAKTSWCFFLKSITGLSAHTCSQAQALSWVKQDLSFIFHL